MNSTTGGFENWKYTVSECRTRITHEDDLINHRLTWLLISQSFLIGAYASISNLPHIYDVSPKDILDMKYSQVYNLRLTLYLLLVIGFVISLFSTIGIFAANTAIKRWRLLLLEKNKTDFMSYFDTTISRHEINFWGSVSGVIPGPVITVVWILLFINQPEHIFKKLAVVDFYLPIGTLFIVFFAWLARAIILKCKEDKILALYLEEKRTSKKDQPT